ncbi:hypothetical protein [Rhodococcus wratislaviensis]|uniref:hypothetical protein n=1 Tax=Rhodococcus wratislaviensis TaxID=44752 RepID=UPI003668A499
MTIEWPAHYPSQCPPVDAEPAVGTYFRLVDAAPPTGEDILSHVELKNAGLRFRNRDFGNEQCIASGFSIFDTQFAAERTRSAVGPLRKKRIAKVDVSGSGVVKQTGGNTSHHTWWRPASDDDWTSCVVVT